MNPTNPPRRQIWGRRLGPRLRERQKHLLDHLLPQIALDLTATPALEPQALFAGKRAIWLEIGFGGGEHLAAQARANPDVGLIGVEPFVTGVAKLLAEIENHGLRTIRLAVDDARLVLRALPDASLERVFVLFPDPWPKARHHKRRIVNDATLSDMARVLADGGELRLATDHMGYALWMLEHLQRQSAFDWLAERPVDWRARTDDWPATRYEQKAVAAGRKPVFLRYRRRAREGA
ncbi:MAG: tRNA (guanosine(46)-N7)-methyltransferase TrmB [Geminicoccaceae bacterium]